ncbi:MAG TPA: PhzF family phenazine biosynthesis isomerase, partial [Ktedonobacteraceae bacterium]
QPLPTFGPVFADREAIAQMLSLDPAALVATLPLEVVSCGVPFLVVPVKSLEAMRAIRLRLDVWERLLRDFAAPHVFAFTQEVMLPDSTVHCRMFAPAMGIAEDPATGAASGPLGCYLVRHGLVEPAAMGPVRLPVNRALSWDVPVWCRSKLSRTRNTSPACMLGGSATLWAKGGSHWRSETLLLRNRIVH